MIKMSKWHLQTYWALAIITTFTLQHTNIQYSSSSYNWNKLKQVNCITYQEQKEITWLGVRASVIYNNKQHQTHQLYNSSNDISCSIPVSHISYHMMSSSSVTLLCKKGGGNYSCMINSRVGNIEYRCRYYRWYFWCIDIDIDDTFV